MKTRKQIADAMRLTPDQIRRLEEKALDKVLRDFRVLEESYDIAPMIRALLIALSGRDEEEED